jgi:hypothetical protein
MCGLQRQVYTTPVLVDRLGRMSQITVGSVSPNFFPFICGISADDGGVYCLGENAGGQLGTGAAPEPKPFCIRKGGRLQPVVVVSMRLSNTL